MTYNDPRDPYQRREQPPQTRAYSQYDAYPEYEQNPHTYGDQNYRDQGYADQGYADQSYGAGKPRTPRRPGPDVDPVMFCGGVLMTGVVTGLAAWLAAWVILTVAKKINTAGTFNGYFVPLSEGEWWFAITGFVVALMGGALWYILQIVTPVPNQFYSWIVGLLVAAAVLLPLLLMENQYASGIGTAIMHLLIGLPVLTLIPTMGRSSTRKH
ncbi:DUF6069 family protein [Gordonia shandongensis]|uniref:DUF6069 family protein n=1 Tax=Gordonia shandongensis TaxID=376351 RepID=UPI00041BB2C9|nr:DUF6069 family protein [Gordonia shandongensis]